MFVVCQYVDYLPSEESTRSLEALPWEILWTVLQVRGREEGEGAEGGRRGREEREGGEGGRRGREEREKERQGRRH